MSARESISADPLLEALIDAAREAIANRGDRDVVNVPPGTAEAELVAILRDGLEEIAARKEDGGAR